VTDFPDLLIFDPKGDIEERKHIQYLITLGGDGTILYAAKQFHQDYIPPIIAFSMVRAYLNKLLPGLPRLLM
jgi:NAD kinase